MGTYCIGDIHGCYDELQKLLHIINFDPQKDKLWFTGDLVNRGPKSLEVLRFVKSLPDAKTVLGNHDLHLLALAYYKSDVDEKHNLHDILTADDKQELLDWLRKRPLFYHDKKLNYTLAHAGIYPLWNLTQAKTYANEVEKILAGSDYQELLKHMYGNNPNKWSINLKKWQRSRFIINCFTRMRFCDKNGRLDLTHQGKIGTQPKEYLPWYEVPNRPTRNTKILFGHWAALGGSISAPKMPNVYALDTGCVWSGCLTAMRLEDREVFKVSCVSFKHPAGE